MRLVGVRYGVALSVVVACGPALKVGAPAPAAETSAPSASAAPTASSSSEEPGEMRITRFSATQVFPLRFTAAAGPFAALAHYCAQQLRCPQGTPCRCDVSEPAKALSAPFDEARVIIVRDADVKFPSHRVAMRLGTSWYVSLLGADEEIVVGAQKVDETVATTLADDTVSTISVGPHTVLLASTHRIDRTDTTGAKGTPPRVERDCWTSLFCRPVSSGVPECTATICQSRRTAPVRFLDPYGITVDDAGREWVLELGS